MDTVEIITAAVATLALIFSLFTYFSAIRHDRKQATLDAFNRLQEQAFDPLNLMRPADIREIVKHPQSPEYKKLSGYLARIEHFCVGVVQKIYDLETVYALAHGYLDGSAMRRRLEPVLDRKNAGANENYFENIQTVLNMMQKRSAK